MSHLMQVKLDKHSMQLTGQAWHVTTSLASTFTSPSGQVNEHFFVESKTSIGFMKIHWLQTEFPFTSV